LERGGLRDALAGLAMHARSVYGIKVAFNNRLPPTAVLDGEVANHLYRIAQEAITNAVKHGHATIVRINLSAMQGKVRLAIADDGAGLPANFEGAQGLGLRIMRYRARIVRGEVRIERGDPEGTRVICECPITSHAIRSKHSVGADAPLRAAARRAGSATVKRSKLVKTSRRAPSRATTRTKGEHK
jgi:signal transduction histidine kinase